MDKTPLCLAASSTIEALSTIEGEIALFRALIRHRPVGADRHFLMLSVCKDLQDALPSVSASGKGIDVDSVWAVLQDIYDLRALDEMDQEGDGSLSSASGHRDIDEFQLPIHPSLDASESFKNLVDSRRLAEAPTPPHTPPPTTSAGLNATEMTTSSTTAPAAPTSVPPTTRTTRASNAAAAAAQATTPLLSSRRARSVSASGASGSAAPIESADAAEEQESDLTEEEVDESDEAEVESEPKAKRGTRAGRGRGPPPPPPRGRRGKTRRKR